MHHIRRMEEYWHHRLRDSLLAQATLCEHIAVQATHESTAARFRAMAQECRAAAIEADKAKET